MSSLKNIQLTFGDNAISSKVLTSSQIEKIVKTIQRSDITTVYNGYVTCDTAISASKAFMLERNGIIYTGSIIPDEYTISASKTTIAEGDEIIFESTGVAVESLSFKVKDITLNSETITKEELLQAISINGNKLKFNSLNKKVDVAGNIIIESNTLYKPYNKKTITLAINSTHITGVTAEYEPYEYDKSINLLNFEDTNSKTVTIVPTGIATIGIGSLIASFENSTNNYNITNITNNSVTLNCINFTTKEPNKLIIVVKDTLGYTCGTIQIDIDNRIPADVNIIGEESVTAYNGNGSFDYYISYTPNYYNVPIVLKEVTSSNNNTSIIINEDNNGFKLKVTGISENISTIITAKFTIDNIEKTITKSINISYAKRITPFIIMNNTGSTQTFSYKMSSGTSSFEIATMQGHVKGVEDYTDVQFSTVNLTSTNVNVTLQDNESFLIWSEIHKPVYNKYLNFVITSFAPDFDGDVLGTCGGDMKVWACKDMFRNCTGLITAPDLPATTLANNCYENMFSGCTGLTTAPELPATSLGIESYYNMFSECTSLTTAPELPATILTDRCYSSMFYGCINLTTAPDLPATKATYKCYSGMFNGCTNLTTAPKLPATKLSSECYANMFRNCTSLITAPDLPATTLANNCYENMFSGCTNLTTAPELPATTLANWCYSNMFHDCKNITNAPELPAISLKNYCYSSMFFGCTGLTTAPELPATTLADYCYSSMFYGCINLTTAPELPATTLTERCYDSMFCDCTSLTTTPELPATTLAAYCYSNMFLGCTNLTTAPELPATTLEIGCYYGMFYKCINLITAPNLPATTLANNCYKTMFYGCTNLTTAPELPSTSLTSYCYDSMFYKCINLTTAPDLPATTLANNCYNNMFSNCTGLITAPELPATTLAQSCYGGMFSGCTSLITAPELPATSLENYCYNYMFNGCTKLNYIKAMFLTTPSSSYTGNWTNNVSPTGTFVKNASASWDVTGVNGIPENWTVETAIE